MTMRKIITSFFLIFLILKVTSRPVNCDNLARVLSIIEDDPCKDGRVCSMDCSFFQVEGQNLCSTQVYFDIQNIQSNPNMVINNAHHFACLTKFYASEKSRDSLTNRLIEIAN